MMTTKQLQDKARELGVQKAADLTGYPMNEVSRWMNGGINAAIASTFAAAMIGSN
ncbi:MAG: hypothetical protein P1U75_16885 [Antarcticimicrobium sp.]|uniref:hypothetical protein n=1 Tax=Antarcticimicrobium sp. TaxID=2824147 RepID=UPI00261158FB|nr:hypothetical protein [Antarcticimicrobium sp.]MDF1718329.1 hypothetical protein [Antarcticimicrobium sp.]